MDIPLRLQPRSDSGCRKEGEWWGCVCQGTSRQPVFGMGEKSSCYQTLKHLEWRQEETRQRYLGLLLVEDLGRWLDCLSAHLCWNLNESDAVIVGASVLSLSISSSSLLQLLSKTLRIGSSYSSFSQVSGSPPWEHLQIILDSSSQEEAPRRI